MNDEVDEQIGLDEPDQTIPEQDLHGDLNHDKPESEAGEQQTEISSETPTKTQEHPDGEQPENTDLLDTQEEKENQDGKDSAEKENPISTEGEAMQREVLDDGAKVDDDAIPDNEESENTDQPIQPETQEVTENGQQLNGRSSPLHKNDNENQEETRSQDVTDKQTVTEEQLLNAGPDDELEQQEEGKSVSNEGDKAVQREDDADECPVDEDLINRKRQEEKEVFQKLIDDVTRLEHENADRTREIDDLKMKLDVCSIELDTEKDKCQDQVEKIRELETQLGTAEKKYGLLLAEQEKNQTEAENSSEKPATLMRSTSHQNKTSLSEQQEDEIRDLHLRVKMMVEADEEKNTRIEKIEAENHEYKLLISKVEHEIGAEKLSELRDNKNGIAAPAKSNQPVKTNEVVPPPESQVCTIL